MWITPFSLWCFYCISEIHCVFLYVVLCTSSKQFFPCLRRCHSFEVCHIEGRVWRTLLYNVTFFLLRSSAETVFSFVKIFVLENLCAADLLMYSRLCSFHPYKNAAIDIGCRAGCSSSNRTSQAWLRVYCSNPFLSSIHRFSPNFSFHYPLSLPRFRTNGLKEMLSSLSVRLPNHYINCVT